MDMKLNENLQVGFFFYKAHYYLFFELAHCICIVHFSGSMFS